MTGKPLRGAKVLVAEDNPILAFDLADLLGQAGAQTLGPVRSLSEALVLVKTPLSDCGVLDVGLGDELVFPAAEVLRDRGLGLVFYTGYAGHDRLSREWPSAHILIKPAPPQLLIGTVTAASCPPWPRATRPRLNQGLPAGYAKSRRRQSLPLTRRPMGATLSRKGRGDYLVAHSTLAFEAIPCNSAPSPLAGEGWGEG
jgi:hypothetical protein